MSNEQDRQKRIDDLIRLNNKKYKEGKHQQEQKQFIQKLSEQQGRHKLKEYAKHIQQVNQKRIKLAKEKQIEKEKELARKQKEKIEKKKRLEEQKEIKKKKAKEEEMKSRRRRNSLEIEEINKKVEQLAHQEMRKIKSGKLLKETEKELKKAKLRELDEKRKEILAKTKKVSIFVPSENSVKENIDDNIEELYYAAREAVNKKGLNCDSILNKLIEDGGFENFEKQECFRKEKISRIQQQQNQQDLEQDESEDDPSEEQQQDESFKFQEVHVDTMLESEQEFSREAPTKFAEKNKQQIANILNTSSDSDPDDSPSDPITQQDPLFAQDIFTLSSAQLFKKQYLRI